MNGTNTKKPAKPVCYSNLGTNLVKYATYMSTMMSKMVGYNVSPEDVVHGFRNCGS